jgi:branched-chain amino acid transport system substrate-binding protein
MAGSPIADAYDAPEFKAFVADYKKNYPDGYPSPSLFALVYYVNMKAALDGLDLVKGDLSDGQKKYREALSKMVLKTPTGDVRLDANRQAIGSTFITEVAKDSKGGLYNKVLRKVDGIDQMLGLKPAEFKIGSRDEPNCP